MLQLVLEIAEGFGKVVFCALGVLALFALSVVGFGGGVGVSYAWLAGTTGIMDDLFSEIVFGFIGVVITGFALSRLDYKEYSEKLDMMLPVGKYFFWGWVAYLSMPILMNSASIVLRLAGYQEFAGWMYQWRFASLLYVPLAAVVLLTVFGIIVVVGKWIGDMWKGMRAWRAS